MTEVLKKIKILLENNSVNYREIIHKPTITSEDSAKARNEDISIGGKSILLKIGNDFKLFVISAKYKINSSNIRKKLKTRKCRFASKEELFNLTGLVSGSVPPFGKPILPFDFYLDEKILENKKIAFNAGSLTNSIIMDLEDYLILSKPKEIFDFAID